MPQTENDHTLGESLADVVRSPLDDRVWCAVIPDDDQWSGTMHASTSAKRCREYAEGKVRTHLGYDPGDLAWRRDNPDSWGLYETSTPPVRSSDG